MKEIIDLNGVWKFAPTHDQKPTNNHNIIATDHPLYAQPNLNRIHWKNVLVPGVWQKYEEKYSIYEGVCWFCRNFHISDAAQISQARLVFKGVNYRAEVYVNGEPVGVHESAYTEFFFDITDFLQEGQNMVAVSVDNRPIIVKWPNDWGYAVYGGIHRDVFLEIYRDNYLTDLEIIPDYDTDSQKGLLKVGGTVQGDLSEVLVTLGEEVKSLPCKDGQFAQVLEYEHILPWSCESPVLYNLTITAEAHTYLQCSVGFRNVCCKDRAFCLNGEVFPIKGACYLYDSPTYGLVMNKDQLRFDLQKMKDANVNAIRTHYPMSDGFYELCDEMGFLVWIEPNIYCSKPWPDKINTVFARQDFVDVAVSMTREMVQAARRFASVAIYGIGNECNVEHPEAMPFCEKIAATVREQDSTKLISYATLYGQVGEMWKLTDLIGLNAYPGWYDTLPPFEIADMPVQEASVAVRTPDVSQIHRLIANLTASIPKDMPILITEFGADSVPGFTSKSGDLWTEDYHAKVIGAVLDAVKAYPQVAGTFVFAFIEYLDPSKPLNGKWNGYNLKGMLTYEREYKLPYFKLQEKYKA